MIGLQPQAVGQFIEQVSCTRWMGHRKVAVYATRIHLSLDSELAETFGTQGNQTAIARPMTLYVSQLDSSNHGPLAGELAPSFMGERFLAERLRYAGFLTLTLRSIARALAQPTVAPFTEDRKHPHQGNLRAALDKLRTRLFQLRDPAYAQSCLDLHVWIARDAEPIGTDRPRLQKTRYICSLPFAGFQMDDIGVEPGSATLTAHSWAGSECQPALVIRFSSSSMRYPWRSLSPASRVLGRTVARPAIVNKKGADCQSSLSKRSMIS